MIWGISGSLVPGALPYAEFCNRAAEAAMPGGFPPLFAYAVACRESIIGEIDGKWDARTVVSGDGGHGIMQLTSSWPSPGWDDPSINFSYAIAHFLIPAVNYWHGLQGYSGDDLIRLASATYNAGLGNAIAGHDIGNVDAYDSDNYGAGVLSIYHNLLLQGKP